MESRIIFSGYILFYTHYYNSGRIYNNWLSSKIKFVWFLHKSFKGNIWENFSFPTMASGISQKFSVYCDKVIAATSRNWTDKCTHSRGEKIVGENWRNIQMYFQTFKNRIVLLLSIRYRTVQCRFVQKALKYSLSSASIIIVYSKDPTIAMTISHWLWPWELKNNCMPDIPIWNYPITRLSTGFQGSQNKIGARGNPNIGTLDSRCSDMPPRSGEQRPLLQS